ncbi:ABC transporter permease [bacterium]|nr:ABC transporter permease [bacterium]MCI0601759.1 ABC transporter permease [bacterium]
MRRLIEFWKDLFSRKEREQELEEELQFHLEMQERANLRAGLDAETAKRSAKLDLGGAQQIKEEVRSQQLGFWFETLWNDAVYGVRMLRKTPGVTFVSLITLGLAIGACTALFSLFHGILLRPLPYPDPERLVEIEETNLSKGIPHIGVSARNLQDWRERLLKNVVRTTRPQKKDRALSVLAGESPAPHQKQIPIFQQPQDRSNTFDGIAVYFTMGRTLSDDKESEVVLASQVSADFFRVFQTLPVLGRLFTEEESSRTKYNGAVGVITPDPLVILSHGLWMRRFGGDPGIVGRSIFLDRRSWKVIGVMPPHFAIPDERTALWIPWGLRDDSPRDQHYAKGVARLSKGVSLKQAEDQLNSIANELAREFPETNQGWGARLSPLQQAITGDLKQLLWFLLAAVCLVLIIACVNIAILQLSRASARVHESSVRLALGASRAGLMRQLLMESLLLSFAGGLLGITLAYFAIAALPQLQPELPRLAEVRINPAVFLVCMGMTAFSALFFGLATAFVATNGKSHPLFHGEDARNTPRASTQRLRNALVITEIALSVILLSASAMLIRSFDRLRDVNPGFQFRNVLVFPVFLDMEKYGSGEKSRSYYKRLIEDLQNLPGIVSVGGATALPTSPLGPDFERPVWEKSGLPVDQSKRHADVRMVTPDYFRTLGISVLHGRGFSAQDTPDSPGVVIVNETLSRQIWPNRSAVGQQLVVDYSTSGTYAYEVIGVVNDVRFRGPRSHPRSEIYFPHAQRSYLVMNMAIRTETDPRLLIGPVREVLRKIDPQKPAHSITPLEDLVEATLVRDRYAMNLVSSFALAALMLALLGIYGVLAFFVRQKVREIGIRLALGARRNQIVGWIARQGASLMCAGLIAGLLGSITFAYLLTGILYEISPRDLFSLLAASVTVVLTALVAAWIPARRASRIDPSRALRYE